MMATRPATSESPIDRELASQIREAATGFCAAEIPASWSLDAVVQAAQDAGYLLPDNLTPDGGSSDEEACSDSAQELALWVAGPTSLGRSIAAVVLETIAEHDPGAAIVLHQHALASEIARCCGVGSHLPQARLATALAAGAVDEESSDAPSASCIVTTADGWTHLLVVDGGPAQARAFLLPRTRFTIQEIPNGLCPDGLLTQRVTWLRRDVPPACGVMARAELDGWILADHVATLAIALGLAGEARDDAVRYAHSRVQGGRPICELAAVSALLDASSDGLEHARSELDAAIGVRGDVDGVSARRLRRATARVAESVSGYVQVCGGTGFMLDSAQGQALRDCMFLRASSGVVLARGGLHAALGSVEPVDARSQTEPARGDALGIQPAIATLPRAARMLVQYERATSWEVDTSRLPRVLAARRRMLRDFADTVIAPHARAGESDDPTIASQARRAAMTAAAQAGLLSDIVPRPLGTLPMRGWRYPLQWSACLKMEELSAACAGLGLAICAHSLGAAPLVLSGDVRAFRRHLLPSLRANARGRRLRLMAYAITEPSAGSDVQDTGGAQTKRVGLHATRDGDRWRLNGTKCFVSGGDDATTIVTFATVGDAADTSTWTCFVVPADSPGFSVVRNEHKLGQRACAASELLFDDVVVDDSHRVGRVGAGWGLNRAVLNYSRGPVGAGALGIARGAVESVVEYCSRTSVAGRPLGDYQAIRLELAQCMVELAAMRSLCWDMGRTFTVRQADASAAKVFCSDQAVAICERLLDLMGNLSFESGLEKRYRDVRLTQIYEGTNDINRLAIYEDMCP